MSDVVGIPGNRIRSFVERIEQIENEIKDLNEAKKEVFSEAKGEGFDMKILKEIIKLRKQDQDERDEHDCLLDVYMRAMDEAGPAPVAEAAPVRVWLQRTDPLSIDPVRLQVAVGVEALVQGLGGDLQHAVHLVDPQRP